MLKFYIGSNLFESSDIWFVMIRYTHHMLPNLRRPRVEGVRGLRCPQHILRALQPRKAYWKRVGDVLKTCCGDSRCVEDVLPTCWVLKTWDNWIHNWHNRPDSKLITIQMLASNGLDRRLHHLMSVLCLGYSKMIPNALDKLAVCQFG